MDAHREMYNAALQERRDAWRGSRTRISYGDQSAQLREIRALRPDLAVWSVSSQQATLRRLDRAFQGFFRRVKAGARPGHPRFKARARFDTVEWPKDGDGARWHTDTGRVYLQGVGRVKGRQVGVDVGIASFATTSDGDHVHNPRWARSAAARLSAAQQRLARAKRGPNNRRRRRDTVAARHRKIANCRRDFHHKTARTLVQTYDLIAVEDLSIANMVRRATPVPDPDNPGQFLPNGAAAKTGLNRSISDAGWGQFVSILRAKAEDAGRIVIEVDPRHTSDGCEKCGHAARENRVTQAVFACRRCGHRAQADEHAARNILRAGLARHAADAA